MKKKKINLEYYLGLNYPTTTELIEDQGKKCYKAEIPDLPGCSAQGKTKNQALKKLEEARRIWIETCYERGLPIPEPEKEDMYSGNFLLRIPVELHMRLTREAKKNNLSLNKYIRQILEQQETIEVLYDKVEQLNNKLKNIELEIRPFLERSISIHRVLNSKLIKQKSTKKVWRFNYTSCNTPDFPMQWMNQEDLEEVLPSNIVTK